MGVTKSNKMKGIVRDEDNCLAPDSGLINQASGFLLCLAVRTASSEVPKIQARVERGPLAVRKV